MLADKVPFVSLVVPVRNERARIEACIASLLEQDYPESRLEILVVDGMSDDGTAALVRDIATTARISVRLVENPDLTMPLGLNHGIAASAGEVVGVISGHSAVETHYVTRAVELLQVTGAWSVGGAIERVGETSMQRAIAAATGSRIGVGDARHNYATTAGWVESVFPGMWPRAVFESIGMFDPAMTANEDNELSLRIREAGGRIWYDPAIRVRYWPRGALGELFTQYQRYARGRMAVYRKHRTGIDWRHLLPPVLTSWIALGWLGALAHPIGLAAWLGSLVGYLAVVAVGSLVVGSANANPLLVTAAVVTMHVAYGTGMIQGVIDSFSGRNSR